MKRRFVAVVSTVVLGVVLGGTGAWAGTSWESYSTTVAATGGYGYTAYQTKAASGAAEVSSSSVGGNKQVSARTNSSKSVGTWTGYVVDDGTSHTLNNSHAAGESVRGQFRNRPQTVVQVQVSGSFKSN
jgi:hypothetical protein